MSDYKHLRVVPKDPDPKEFPVRPFACDFRHTHQTKCGECHAPYCRHSQAPRFA